MPQLVKKFRILVASPSDVIEERETINSVIDELNSTYGSRNNLIIEIVKWESHSAPGISISHTQDLIDDDFGSNYDLFLGVLWKKFGTKTINYDSGTEQEFRNAHQRFIDDPNSLQILFYFKMTAIPVDEIDIEQFSKIKNFKSELGSLNVFYWQYNTIEEFQRFLRIHIPKRIDLLNKLIESPVLVDKNDVIVETKDKVSDDNEELGIIDLNYIIEESFSYSTESLSRITQATEWIGEEMKKKTVEIERLTAKGDVARKALNDWFERSAKMMTDFASRLEPEVSVFETNFQQGIDAISKLILLYDAGDGLFESQKEEIKQSLEGLVSSIESGVEGMEVFLNSISNLPRMQKDFNKARRVAETAVFEILASMKVISNLSLEVLKSIV